MSAFAVDVSVAESPAPRGFAELLKDSHIASRPQSPGAKHAADRLPLSEWGESRRHGETHMTPQTVAANWRLNVSDAAHALRAQVHAYDSDAPEYRESTLRDAAAELLRMLGEI